MATTTTNSTKTKNYNKKILYVRNDNGTKLYEGDYYSVPLELTENYRFSTLDDALWWAHEHGYDNDKIYIEEDVLS